MRLMRTKEIVGVRQNEILVFVYRMLAEEASRMLSSENDKGN